ncbi:MAG: archaellin/type IV pilin N-terminal domain-containing protein [Candidatus Hodarchaeales archaeon]
MIIKIIYNKKKRAISPVIAVILLIGLAVAAVAAIFIVVLPLMQPSSNLELTDAFIEYDSAQTKIADANIGYGVGTVILANAGTGKIKITDIKIFHAASSAADDWTEITTQDGAESLEYISINNPYELNPTAFDEDLSISFPIPVENIDDSRSYKIIVTADDGTEIDTSRESIVDEEDMSLAKDRPEITPPSSIGTIRRTTQISASGTPTDNSEVKNVTYEVYTNPSDPIGSQVRFKTITSSLWRWQWNTINSTLEGLDNGSYYLRMTVYDYAGLSQSHDASALPFEIDNDYVKPTISSVTGESLKGGPDLAEVGESFAITATITDSGSGDSSVDEAFVYYKLNDTNPTYSVISMTSSGDTWSSNIPAPFINSDALDNNLTYFVRAIDIDENENQSSSYFADVNDSTEPNFISHEFEGESVITQDPLVGTEGQTMSLSVEVEDKDKVQKVTMVWRERNDTGISPQYGDWKVFVNNSGSGEIWGFSLPALNVTLDGLEYYFNSTDVSNNTAYEGSALSPYRIIVADELNPVISVVSTIPESITEDTDLVVSTAIADNDKTFSWTSQETGTVELGYRKPGEGVYTYLDMSHTSGDSSIGETAIWEGTIGGSNFSISATPVWVQIRAIDQSGKTSLHEQSISVTPAGTPLLIYVAGSGDVSGTSNELLEFDVKNDASGPLDATANITDIQIELISNGKTILDGLPVATQIEAPGVVWQNSTDLEGSNNTKITLDTSFLLAKSATVSFTVTYANSSGGYYDLNDLTVYVTISYDSTVDTDLTSFDTPSTQSIPQTETRFLRSNAATVNGLTAYDLGTDLTGSIAVTDQSSTVSGDQAVTWGIRVYVRHSDTSEAEITSGMVATVARGAGGDASGIQNGNWLCPQTALSPTDSIVIEVWYQIGGNSPAMHIEFTTPQLGATQLDASTWSVFYYTERDRAGGFFSRTTTAIFHWGDAIHNSRIENFEYSTSGAGAPMIMNPLTSIGELPESPVSFTIDRVSQTSFVIERRGKTLP